MKKTSALSGILGAAKGKIVENDETETNESERQSMPEARVSSSSSNSTTGQKGREPAVTENGKSTNTKIPKTVNTANEYKRGDEKLVHITIEVPQSLRHHWKIESARKNRSFRDVAVDAFTKEFGLPEKGEK